MHDSWQTSLLRTLVQLPAQPDLLPFWKKTMPLIAVESRSHCLLRGNVSTLYTINKKIREQRSAAAGTYWYSQIVCPVPWDPLSKGPASESRSFLHGRDRFALFSKNTSLLLTAIATEGFNWESTKLTSWEQQTSLGWRHSSVQSVRCRFLERPFFSEIPWTNNWIRRLKFCFTSTPLLLDASELLPTQCLAERPSPLTRHFVSPKCRNSSNQAVGYISNPLAHSHSTKPVHHQWERLWKKPHL